jgi:hypothetical protein
MRRFRNHPHSFSINMAVITAVSLQPRSDRSPQCLCQLITRFKLLRSDQTIYIFFDRFDKAHEDEADAIADAVSYIVENPNPSQLTPAQI